MKCLLAVCSLQTWDVTRLKNRSTRSYGLQRNGIQHGWISFLVRKCFFLFQDLTYNKLTIVNITYIMHNDDLSIEDALDWAYEEDMKWRDEHPIRAKWHDFKTFFKTGKFEEEIPF